MEFLEALFAALGLKFKVVAAGAVGAFISVSNGGYVVVGGAPYSGVGSGAGTTGKRYDVTSNGVLRLNGVTLPGNAAGTVIGGGQVL